MNDTCKHTEAPRGKQPCAAGSGVAEPRASDHRIRNLPEDDRPREKLLRRGAEALSDTELLAILINAGDRRHSALDLARDLLRAQGSLRAIARRTAAELQGRRGIGPARAVTLLAAFELGRRSAAEAEEDRLMVNAPEDVARRYVPLMRDLTAERFVVLMLDNAGRVMREQVVSEGILNAAIVHPREVFRGAIAELASSLILLHNHPSGVREASAEDRRITRQLVDAGRTMGIPVQDHIIICGNGYVSFAENGWL
jgi:DNA repair protein RadC